MQGPLSSPTSPPMISSQLAHDGEAEPGASVAPVGSAIGLGEALEDRFLRLRRNAGPGIGDLEAQQAGTALTLRKAALDQPTRIATWPFSVNFTALATRLNQNLAQMLAATTQKKRHGGIEMHQQMQALALSLRPEEGDQIGEFSVQIEVDDVNRHLARLDLGKIEDLVDEREQRPAGTRHRPRHVALLVVEAGILQ